MSVQVTPHAVCVLRNVLYGGAGLASATPACQRLRQHADSFNVLFAMPAHVCSVSASMVWRAGRGKGGASEQEHQRLIKNVAIRLGLCHLRLPHFELQRCYFTGSAVINLALYCCSDLSLNSSLLLLLVLDVLAFLVSPLFIPSFAYSFSEVKQ